MRLTARQLNRATLSRQLLLRRESLGVVDAVHRVVALQAQEPASPYLALWNRLAGFDPADLDRAFADHAIVKATADADHAARGGHAPTTRPSTKRCSGRLRAARLSDRRFTSDRRCRVADADALMPEVLEFAASRGRTPTWRPGSTSGSA